MAEVDEYQLEKISTLFNSRPPYIPKSCILFLSILPFPWLFKTKKKRRASHSLMQQTE